MENYLKLKKLIIDLEPEIKRIFEKDQMKAGRRIRWELQRARRLAKALRQDIRDRVIANQEKRNDLKSDNFKL